MGSGVKLVKTGLPYNHEPMEQHDDSSKTFPGYRIVPVSTEDNYRSEAPAYSSQALIMGNVATPAASLLCSPGEPICLLSGVRPTGCRESKDVPLPPAWLRRVCAIAKPGGNASNDH